jgi:adenine-specific DNA-methyltransferase
VYKSEVKIEPISRRLKNLHLSENLGAVYTPEHLADWVASLLLEYLQGTKKRLVDPACGDGALLVAVSQQCEGKMRLEGIDVDKEALKCARNRIPNLKGHRKNALSLLPDVSALNGQYDGVIMNPPWGADPGFSSQELRELGYTLAWGQFDTYDLFIELALRLIHTNGILVAIVPDSLFLPEHEGVRRMLATQTEICMIARLGEGFFEGIYRGASVIVVRKTTPRPEHRVHCIRLNKAWRQKILSGQSNLQKSYQEVMHSVLQSRFLRDNSIKFDIDIKESEESTVEIIGNYKNDWTKWFDSGRGVEISKLGKILHCPNCDYALPCPRIENITIVCRECKKLFTFTNHDIEIVIRPNNNRYSKQWQALIVGEDVDRYKCSSRRQIKIGVEGINYKDKNIFAKRKLLVRKTGLGIKAAIDETGSFTNQVVFHYTTTNTTPDFAMDYVQGVLCSRALLAYHLKSVGETEWRSHPYVTQKILSELPIPVVHEGTWQWKQAKAIASAVKNAKSIIEPGSNDDLYIERLCTGLYGMTASDCDWIVRVLNDTEGLEPLRTLRLKNALDIQPLVVN